MGVEENLLKNDVFPCINRGGDAFQLTLSSSKLVLKAVKTDKVSEEYSTDDIFGCEVRRSEKVKSKRLDSEAAYLCFYLYPRSRRYGLLRQTRLRQKVLLLFKVKKPGQTLQENVDLASDWKRVAILQCKQRAQNNVIIGEDKNDFQITSLRNVSATCMSVDGLNIDSESNMGVPELMHKAASAFDLARASSELFQLRYVLVMNPKSGQGKTVALYQEQVAPILQEAGIHTEVLITEAAGHASSFASTADLSGVHGIISLGGDGLLFEIVNGLRSRDDSEYISKIPMGVIAGGSGNGLARSLAAYSNESDDYLKNPVLSTTLAVARGRVIPVNLTEVTLDNKRMHSFLSVGWGLLADIDIESEVLRPFGESRFTLWSFLRLLKLRHYHAKLSYVIANDEETNDSRSNAVETVDDFLCVYSSCQSYIGSDLIFAPAAKPNDGVIHLTYIKKNAGRACATKYLLGLDKGSHTKVSGVTYLPVREFTIAADGGIAGNLVVDGERVFGEKITARISPAPLYVFAL